MCEDCIKSAGVSIKDIKILQLFVKKLCREQDIKLLWEIGTIIHTCTDLLHYRKSARFPILMDRQQSPRIDCFLDARREIL